MIRKIILAFSLIILLRVDGKAQTQIDNAVSPYLLPYLKSSRFQQIASTDTTGGNADFVVVKDGEAKLLARIAGPGIITRIWITISSRDVYFLRRTLVRMYWDDEVFPSVEVPVGDFFGTGFEYRQFVSQFVGMTSGGYYCYFPMPFQKSARIEVVNQTGKEIPSLYYHVDYQKLDQPLESSVANFHAQWRREVRTNPTQNYTVLEATGEGQYVGTIMSMQSYNGKMSFLEGDEMVFVDGEKNPSMYGTGTEDYFTSGWYFNGGEYSAPYHGLILKNDSLGRVAAYRFHVGDAIPFKRSLRFTIEHGHANEELGDYCSTAFWYQKEPHKKFTEMTQANLRLPLRAVVPNGLTEAESLEVSESTVRGRIEDMSKYGPDWSNNRQMRFDCKKVGDQITVDIPSGMDEKFNLDVYYTRGPEYGNADVLFENKKVGEIRGYDPEPAPSGKIRLTNVQIVQGRLPISIIVTGKDTKSASFTIGLDGVLRDPIRNYIPEWNILGPFPNPKNAAGERTGLDVPYAPEKEKDIVLTKTYPGMPNQMARWTVQKINENGLLDLYKKFDPNDQVVSYALTYVYSPAPQYLQLLFGADDGIKVFLNDKEVFRKLVIQIPKPDNDAVVLPLKKDWNKVMLKIENNVGGYGFYARIIDPNKSLIIATKMEAAKLEKK